MNENIKNLNEAQNIFLENYLKDTKTLSKEQLHDIAMESLLDKLFTLTVFEKERELSYEETEYYIVIYNTLIENNVEIPFGVEI